MSVLGPTIFKTDKGKRQKIHIFTQLPSQYRIGIYFPWKKRCQTLPFPISSDSQISRLVWLTGLATNRKGCQDNRLVAVTEKSCWEYLAYLLVKEYRQPNQDTKITEFLQVKLFKRKTASNWQVSFSGTYLRTGML